MDRPLFTWQLGESFYSERLIGKKGLNDFRLLPFCVVVLITGLHFLFVVSGWIRHAIVRKYTRTEAANRVGSRQNTSYSVQHSGGASILVLSSIRLLACGTLLSLSSVTLRKCTEGCANISDILEKCPEYGISLSFVYAILTAAILVFSKKNGPLAGNLNIVTLLTVLGVYLYRDIYPLAMYTRQPADIHEGKVIWAKIGILAMAAIIIPLFTPRRYVPIDPKDPMHALNREQTAPWISRLTFSYIDPIIVLASRVPHLSYEQLPPLIDDDSSKHHSTLAFPHIELCRTTKRHVFFGLMRYFRRDYILFTSCLVLSCVSSFVSPIGIKQTLQYLETGGKGSIVRPWVWVSLIFLGPLLASMTEHWCVYIMTKIRARFQAVVTQVVFEHSLRIRLKAGVNTDPASDFVSSPPTPRNESVGADNHSDDHSQEGGHELSGSGSSTIEPITDGPPSDDDTLASKNIRQSTSGESKPSQADNLIGRINNLVTSDQGNMSEGLDFLTLLMGVPLQIILCLTFLYQILGWSSLVGFASIAALSPVGGYVGKKMQAAQANLMKMTDARVQKISEVVSILRMIKLFGWESKMAQRMYQSREQELGWLWKMKVLTISSNLISYLAPMASMLLTYTTYTVLMKQELTASRAFSSMSVFYILINQFNRIAWQTSLIIEGKVSVDRLNDFIQNTEVLDRFSGHKLPLLEDSTGDDRIGFRRATFAWSAANDGSLTPTSRKFRLNISEEVIFKRNCINMIVGPTGCGKTSMLMALLGEMHFIPSSSDSWYNLPRRGGVSYAAQESWVQNATIRENILFESPYDEARYQEVLRQCALEADLKLFEAGDQTEVGERGLTLSGGQKARVTLARAIYSSAEIILLDDVLAALDVHTSTWIVNECFRGKLVKGRTILLVTHNVALIGSLAQFVVSIGLDGKIRSQGNDVSTALLKDPVLAAEVAAEVEGNKKETELKEEAQAAEAIVHVGKLTVPEEIAQGHVTWRSMKLVLSGLGGSHPIFFCVAVLSGLTLQLAFNTSQIWFLGVWAAQYEKHHPSEIPLGLYVAGFAGLLLGNTSTFGVTNLYYHYRSVSASRTIHSRLINSVFGSTFRWLDQTPTSRILARCTQDIRTIDASIAQSLLWVIQQIIGASMKLFIIAYLTPVFLLPGFVIGVFGIVIGNLYLKAQLSVKREMSNARSPMLGHFSAAIHGLVSLRAYNAQQSFKTKSYKHIDHYTRTLRISNDLNRWIALRIDALGAAFTASLAAYLVYGTSTTASTTGFSLNLAISFCTNIFWLIRIFNEFEVEANSLERIQHYIDIEHESPATDAGIPPASWPTSGTIRVENLNAQYSPTGPKVLKNVSFNVESGERIGIVGRTGSGKSSLTLALLRCILTEGTVYYDGIPIDKINLETLRSNITIIPQTPELLSGTLRENLDPLDENDDATLNHALQSSGLFSLQQDEAQITLDTHISSGGGNLSVGQRQIIALARAIIRRSKLLILDEATSAVDYKTDAVIQRTLRTEIGPDVTVITIAHRLQTIMDADKIMVFDSGNMVEFDTPQRLLQKEGGVLRALVEGSKDKGSLTASAEQ